MARAEVVLILALVLLVTCSATPIDIETVYDVGCTSQETKVFKELRWRDLDFNSTIWLEVHNLQPAKTTTSSSSLYCPEPCEAQKNTFYKVDLQQHETESNKIKVNFAAHEEPGSLRVGKPPGQGESIQCICQQESLLVFEGSSTLVTCKEESEVSKVRESWRARLTSGTNRTPIIIAVAVGFLAIALVCVLCIVLRVCVVSKEQPRPGKLVRKPTPSRSTQIQVSKAETNSSSLSHY